MTTEQAIQMVERIFGPGTAELVEVVDLTDQLADDYPGSDFDYIKVRPAELDGPDLADLLDQTGDVPLGR